MEKCPYHEIKPQYKATLYREKITVGRITLPKLCEYRFICPECQSEWEKTGLFKYKKLADGFYSGSSKAAAAYNWNKGVKALALALFKQAVAG